MVPQLFSATMTISALGRWGHPHRKQTEARNLSTVCPKHTNFVRFLCPNVAWVGDALIACFGYRVYREPVGQIKGLLFDFLCSK